MFLTRTTFVTTATLQILVPQMSEYVSPLSSLKELSSEQLLVGSNLFTLCQQEIKRKIYIKDNKLYRKNYIICKAEIEETDEEI